MEMLFGLLPLPPGAIDEPLDKFLFTSDQIHHATLRMSDERNRPDAADSNRVGDLEFAVP